MGLIELKENLHKLIDQVNDESVLKAQYELLSKELALESDEDNSAVTLSEEERAAIQKGIDQIDQGEFYTHAEVKAKLKAKYPQLHTR